MSEVSEEARAEYQEAFDMFDKDKSGSIDEEELGCVMRRLGHEMTDEELKQMVAKVDTDNNGEIDFDEFLAMMLAYNNAGGKDNEMKQAFKQFDINGDGKISRDELKQTMKYLGADLTDEQVEDMIRQADMNEDGEVDFEEFKKMMSEM